MHPRGPCTDCRLHWYSRANLKLTKPVVKSYRLNSTSKSASLDQAQSTVKPLVSAPPSSFDFRLHTRSRTEKIVRERYPELLDLAASGVLVAVERREDYQERRSDGYREPEIVFLVGTVHISQGSADAARRVVESVKPDNVVLELCRGRTGVLYSEAEPADEVVAQEKAGAKGQRLAMMKQSVQNALDGSGSAGSLLMLFLANAVSSKLQDKAGVKAGVEMRSAKAAADVVGAQLVLGDRPIEITVERVWSALGWKARLQLMRQLVTGLAASPPEVDGAQLKALEADDAVEMMTQQLTEAFPQVASAVLHERDLYLAWSCKRSKAVNGCTRVVAIIGRGHLPGVVYHLLQDSSNLRFRDLAGSRRKLRKKGEPPKWLLVIVGNVALVYACQLLWDFVSQRQTLFVH